MKFGFGKMDITPRVGVGSIEEDGMATVRRASALVSVLIMSVAAAQARAATDATVELYVVPPIIEDRVLPSTKQIPGYKDNLVRVVGCPGEYVPATFVVRPKQPLSLLPKATVLTGPGPAIPAQNVNIRIVKCWYQDVGKGYSKRIRALHYNPLNVSGQRRLVPELLLKDPELVKVNTESKTNFVRIRQAVDGKTQERYVNVSDPAGIVDEDGTKLKFPKNRLPMQDAEELLPVKIPAGENQQFWVTVHIPEKAKPGIYSGKIELTAGGRSIGDYRVQLRVLPFKLLPPYYISSMNHHSRLADAEHKDHLRARNEQQYRTELKNLLAHGVTNPLLAPGYTPELFERMLQIRQELGMSGQPLFYQDYAGVVHHATFKGKSLEWLKEEVKKRLALARKYGFTEVYFYGQDEAKGDELTAQRDAWKAVRETGGKIFVAGYGKAHFDAMGDLTDFFREPRYLSRELAQLWHSKGHMISSYANPQCGAEQPLAYRRNYGLLLWQYDYDSAMDFSFYVSAFGHIWNDFDHDTYKDHNMVYPTDNGVIDTVQWEGYREAVDDVRYMATLQHHIALALKAGGEKADSAKEAERFVAELKKSDVNEDDVDLDVLRIQMIGYLLKLVGNDGQEG